MSLILEPGTLRPSATVAGWMTKDVAACAPDASLADAARIMWDRDCGFVPVTGDAGRVCGVVTDRDACMASLTQGKALHELPVRLAMTTGVVTVGEGEPVARAHALMREHQVRRLPVVDASERLVGVLSLNDVARHAAAEAHGTPRRDVAATLAEICRRRELVPV